MPKQLMQLLPLLRCPVTKSKLVVDGEFLVSGDRRYPIVDGRPVLVQDIRSLNVTPPGEGVVSQNLERYYPPESLAADGVCLHLGSGNVPADDDRVISMDVLLNTNVDIVAEAEALPFGNGTIDLVVSGAVFEHLADPIASIKEVRRVLKDGGRLVIDTAFMQGYHGFPSHYFNMTPQAVEAVLCDDFVLEDSHVPKHAGPSNAIRTQIDRYLEFLPQAARENLRVGSVASFLDFLANHSIGGDADLSEYARRSLAASFVVVAKKPPEYSALCSNDPSSSKVRTEFYAARMAVIQHHHEVCHYYSLRSAPFDYLVPQAEAGWLEQTLHDNLVENPMSIEEFQSATYSLQRHAEDLVAGRDRLLASLYRQSQEHEASVALAAERRRRSGVKWQAHRFKRWISRRILTRGAHSPGSP